MLVLLAHAIEDSTDIFGILGGFEPPKPPPWYATGFIWSASRFGRITPRTHRRGQLPNIFSLEEFFKYLFISPETPV